MKSLNLKNKYEAYSKNFKLRFLAILVILYGVLFFGYLHEFSPKIASAEISDGHPILLSIPKTGAIIKIEEVVKNNEFINPPQSTLNTGWYNAGPQPGEVGSAVIDGYVHWKYGYTARFADLNLSELGDIIETTDDRGVITTFRVREVKNYQLNDNLNEVFNSNDGKSHLNLVTYDGSWDTNSKSYSKRIVIFSDMESTTTITERLTEKENARFTNLPDKLTENLNIVDEKALLASFY